jgi:hypothetical protein
LAKVRFKNLSDVVKTIDKKIDSTLADDLGDKIGELLVGQVQGFTRKGEPYNKNRTFPILAESTVESRVRLSKSNNTHPSFRKTLSAVTLTGQLMDSLKHRVVKVGRSLQIFLEFTGTRKPYKNLDGSVQKLNSKNSTNEALNKTLGEIGFNVLSGQAVERDTRLIARVRKLIVDRLRRELR